MKTSELIKFHQIIKRNYYRWVLDWWLDLLDTYTTRDCTSQISITHRLVFSVTLLGSSFQQRTFLCSGLPSAASSRAGLTSNCQPPTSAVNSQLTSSRTNSQCTIGSLCSLSADRIENTASNSFFSVVCTRCLAVALVLLCAYTAVA
jgi:hypothetical protein